MNWEKINVKTNIFQLFKYTILNLKWGKIPLLLKILILRREKILISKQIN